MSWVNSGKFPKTPITMENLRTGFNKQPKAQQIIGEFTLRSLIGRTLYTSNGIAYTISIPTGSSLSLNYFRDRFFLNLTPKIIVYTTGGISPPDDRITPLTYSIRIIGAGGGGGGGGRSYDDGFLNIHNYGGGGGGGGAGDYEDFGPFQYSTNIPSVSYGTKGAGGAKMAGPFGSGKAGGEGTDTVFYRNGGAGRRALGGNGGGGGIQGEWNKTNDGGYGGVGYPDGSIGAAGGSGNNVGGAGGNNETGYGRGGGGGRGGQNENENILDGSDGGGGVAIVTWNFK